MIEVELHSVDLNKDSRIDVAVLLAQSNLLGTIKDLPIVLREYKKKLEEEKKYKDKMAEENSDPLDMDKE